MALSYTQKTSDTSLITKYVREHRATSLVIMYLRDVRGQEVLYEQFGNYLAQNGLYMVSQPSSDSFAGELGNQTNLAVKVCLSLDIQPGLFPNLQHRSNLFSQSIVALKAASEIFRILGNDVKSKNFDVRCLFLLYDRDVVEAAVAEYCHLVPGAMAERRALVGQVSLYPLLRKQSIVSIAQGNAVILTILTWLIRWSLLYNLYADRLLGFNMFPKSVYDTREFVLFHAVLCQPG